MKEMKNYTRRYHKKRKFGGKTRKKNKMIKEKCSPKKKENEFYLDRIKRLQPNTIDLDYLDETFRKVTGFTSENETVIIIE